MTGGRNGYGAKLANIFSTEFTLETQAAASGKAYKQASLNRARSARHTHPRAYGNVPKQCYYGCAR